MSERDKVCEYEKDKTGHLYRHRSVRYPIVSGNESIHIPEQTEKVRSKDDSKQKVEGGEECTLKDMLTNN